MKPLFCCGAAKGDFAFQGRNTAAAAGCVRGKITRRGGERALRAANRAVSWQGDDSAAQPCQRGNAEDAKCKKTGLKDAAKSVFSFFTLSHWKRGVCWGIFLSGEDRQTGKERPLLLCYKRGFVSGPPFLAAAQQLKWRTAKWPAAIFIASQ